MNNARAFLSAGLAALLIALALTSCSLREKDAAQSGRIDDSDAVVITFDAKNASVSGSGASADNAVVRITKGGVYRVRGSTADGRIVVDAPKADVRIVLDGARITAADSSAICILAAKQTTIYAKEGTESELTDNETYAQEDADACIWSKSDLILSGGGTLTVNGRHKKGIVSKDTLLLDALTLNVTAENDAVTGKDGITIRDADVTVTAGGGSETPLAEDASAKGFKSNAEIIMDGGSLTIDSADDGIHAHETVTVNSGKITVKTGDDGIHAEDTVRIFDGDIKITGHEGIEATRIMLDGGRIAVTASDDGINAAQKIDNVTPTVEINGGEIEIEMAQGDTDGIDANGDIIINGGTVRVTAQFPFDYDGKAELNGGDVYVNGAKVTQLINQFGGKPGEPPKRPDGSFPQDREPPEGFEPPQNGESPQGGEPPKGFEPPQGGGFPKGMPPQEDPFPFGTKDGADRKGAETAPAVPGTET